MLLALGIFIIGAVLIYAAVATWQKRITAAGFFGIGLIGIMAGATVTKLPDIIGFKLQGGTTPSFDVQIQRVEQTAEKVTTQAQQVQTDTGEVRQMKEQIEALLKRVEQGEQNVSRMHGSLQETWRSLFESFAYVVMTRNLFPPPPFITQEVERHINIMGVLAYPNPQERAVAIQKITENIQKAQGR